VNVRNIAGGIGIAVAIVVLFTAGLLTGHSVNPAIHNHTQTVTKVVMRTINHTVIRYRTRTVTVQSAPAQSPSSDPSSAPAAAQSTVPAGATSYDGGWYIITGPCDYSAAAQGCTGSYSGTVRPPGYSGGEPKAPMP